MDKLNILFDLSNRPLSLYRFKLPFSHTLNFKGHHLIAREGLWLVVHNQQQVLIGEISPLPGFSRETLAQCQQQLLAILTPFSQGQTRANNNEFTTTLLPSVNFALFCLQEKLPWHAYHSKSLLNALPTIPLLQGSTPAIIERYLQLECPNKIKLKVARDNLEQDVNLIMQLVNINPRLQLRLDANQQWTALQYTNFLMRVSTQNIDYIEEPTQSLIDNIRISNTFNVGIALDESLLSETTLPKHNNIKAIIVKPTLIGCPNRFKSLMTYARAQRLHVSVSSSFESPIAINQLHHLAQQWQQTYQVEMSLGLDTLYLYDDEILNKSKQLDGQNNPFLNEAECLWQS
jgi:O-succinylbenzoate synthase